MTAPYDSLYGTVRMVEGMRVRLLAQTGPSRSTGRDVEDPTHASWIAGKVPVGETGTLHLHKFPASEHEQWHVVWDHPTKIRDKADPSRGFRFGLSMHMLPSWLEVLP